MPDRPYRVGIITRPIDQKTSGSCNYQRQLLNAFLDLDHGFDITLIHYTDTKDPVYSRDGVTETIIPRDPIRASLAVSRLDLDLLHYAPYTILSPIWAKTRRRMASILGAGPLFIPGEYSRIHYLHARFIEPILIRRLDAILSCSHASGDFAREHYGFKGQVHVAYASIPDDFKPADTGTSLPAALSHRVGINGPYVLHVSRHSNRKNPTTILEGYRRYRERTDSANALQLVVAGSEWDNEKVQSFVTTHDLEDAIRFTGYTDEQDLIQLLQHAEIFLFPSLYEGFGMPNIEAMACGCPVITSKSFAIPEVVGDAAVLMEDARSADELAGHITDLLKDEDKREQLRRAGLERVRKFSWAQGAEILREAYLACIEGRSQNDR